MANDEKPYNLSLKAVCDILGKSERTVYRYVTRGRLSVRHITTETGRQIRFNEEEVAKLRDSLTSGVRPENGGVSDTNDRMSGPENTAYKELLAKYEQVLVQIGYFRAKADEIKLLEARAASLQDEATKFRQQASQLEAEKQTLEAEKRRLTEQAASSQATLEQKEQQLLREQRRARAFKITAIVGITLLILEALYLILVGPRLP